MNNADCLQLYETYLKGEKKASENTLSSYLRDIRQFADFLDYHLSTDLYNSDNDCINQYILYLKENNSSDATVSRKIASIKNFYKFLYSKNLIEENPSGYLIAQKVIHKLPEILSVEEINLLLSQPDMLTMKGIRDKAMLELLYATGLRVSELLNLNISDIDIHSECLICSGKNKERIIPVYRKAIEVIKNYLAVVRPSMIASLDENALFVNTSGERMTRQGFWKLIKKYQKSAGIEKDITPHTLRHSFAAHLVENGADLYSLQEMMGHSNIASTSVYSAFMKHQIRDVYNSAHPRA